MLNYFLRFIFFIGFSCLTSVAFAGEPYTIYALLDADTLYGVINGIAALMNSPMFKTILICFGLLGLAWIILLTALQRNYIKLPIYILGSMIFLQFVLHQHVKVTVVSQMTGRTYAVENVPGILAVPISYLSVLGVEGAKIIEAAYATSTKTTSTEMPSTLLLSSGTPFSFTNQLMIDSTTYQIQDPYLNSSMIHFIVDCGIPAIDAGKLTMTQLLDSNNIWSLFNASMLNPSLMTVYFGYEKKPQNTVLTCPQSYSELNKIWGDAEQEMIKKVSKNYMAGVTAKLFTDILDYNAKNNFYNPTPGAYLQQAAILNLLKGPVQKFMAGKSQSAMLMQSLSVSQATEATELNWISSAEVFAKTMGYIYSALQILIFAIAPILVLFAIFPGAGALLAKRYLTLLAWFPMTFIMLAICNDLILSWSHNELSNIFTNYEGLVRSSQVLITAKAAKMQKIGAFLIAVTPILSFGIIAGLQVPITNILSHSGALTFGSQAGQLAASGNMSLDNQSYNNVGANKFNTTSVMDVGSSPVEMSVSGANSGLKANFGGSSAFLNGAPDMISHQTQSNAQHSYGSGQITTNDTGGSVTRDDGFQSSATVGHSAQDTISTAIDGGFNFSKVTRNSNKAMKAAAATAGVAMSAEALNALSLDLAQGKLMSDEAYKAGERGDFAAKHHYLQKAQNFFNQSIDHAKSSLSGSSWKGEAALGAVIGAGVVAAFATGVGEVAVGGVALAAATASQAGSAELGGEALKAAAIDQGVVMGIGKGLNSLSKNNGLKSSLKNVLGNFVAGFQTGIVEGARGSYESHLGAEYGSKTANTAQTRDSFATTHKVDDQSNITISTTDASSYVSPSKDLDQALQVLNPNATNSIDKASDAYSHARFDVIKASKQVQSKIHHLKNESRDWQKRGNRELLDRGQKYNQLTSKTDLQKDVGIKEVDE